MRKIAYETNVQKQDDRHDCSLLDDRGVDGTWSTLAAWSMKMELIGIY